MEKELLDEIKKLKKSKIKRLIDKKIKEFQELGKSKNKIFNELCFCILTANSTAERCILVQNKVGNGFIKLRKNDLIKKLKQLSCRFHTKRAGYIVEARKCCTDLFTALSLNPFKAREWLMKNVKGLGMKEASHFLRNIGFKDLAIIDFHIVDVLAKHKIIKKPKNLGKEYIKIEEKLREIAKKAKLSLAELDLYLWYMETGKILK
jgi:N-glycosylase/DNA lyase